MGRRTIMIVMETRMQTPLEGHDPAGGADETPASIFSQQHHFFQIFGIAAFFAMEALLFWRVFSVPASLPVSMSGMAWGLLVGGLLFGYVSGDFISGFVHWLFDRYGSVNSPVVGKPFVLPFRIHHVDPMDITRHGFVDTNGNNCLASDVVLLAALLLPAPVHGGLNLFVQAAVAALGMGVFGTNQFHKWSHEIQPSPLVAWLQDHNIILGRAHHDIHHTPPFDKYYCIMAGWLNPPLTAIGFWPKLEKLVFTLTGVEAGIEDAATVAAAKAAGQAALRL